MKSDFVVALTQLAAERELPREIVLSAIEDALVSAYKKESVAAGQDITVNLDPASGDVTVHVLKTVVADVDAIDNNNKSEIALSEAKKIDPRAAVGEVITTESMQHIPGRIAAQTAKQVVMQRLLHAEREIVFKQFEDKAGEVFLVTLQKIEPRQIMVDLGRSEAVMPISEQVSTERYRSNTKMRVLLKSVERSSSVGPTLIVSRADKILLKRLFEMEVPEISSGAVEIEGIAREAGSRSKVAVRARQDGVDPVGSCVGLRGVRIQNIVNELHGEKIDVVEWHREAPIFIANALSPAQVLKVELNVDDQTAMAVVPDRQLSLAIGREGQNARLAARLTGWKVEIKSDVDYQVELEERARIAAELQAQAEIAAADLAAATPVVEAAPIEPTPVEVEAVPHIPEVDDAPEPIAAELTEATDADDSDLLDTADEDEVDAETTALEPEPVVEEEEVEAEPVVAEQHIAAEEAVDDVLQDAVAEVEEVEPIIQEPQPILEPVLEPAASVEERAVDERTTSLRDLPDDIWTVRRARVRRPSTSDENEPGRIRFAEDIVGLRGGVMASRRNRRRNDAQTPGNANDRNAPRKRKAGRRRR